MSILRNFPSPSRRIAALSHPHIIGFAPRNRAPRLARPTLRAKCVTRLTIISNRKQSASYALAIHPADSAQSSNSSENHTCLKIELDWTWNSREENVQLVAKFLSEFRREDALVNVFTHETQGTRYSSTNRTEDIATSRTTGTWEGDDHSSMYSTLGFAGCCP